MVDGPPGVSEVFLRNGARVNDRVAPIVQGDVLGEQFGADAVAVAGDGVKAQAGLMPMAPVWGKVGP